MGQEVPRGECGRDERRDSPELPIPRATFRCKLADAFAALLAGFGELGGDELTCVTVLGLANRCWVRYCASLRNVGLGPEDARQTPKGLWVQQEMWRTQ